MKTNLTILTAVAAIGLLTASPSFAEDAHHPPGGTPAPQVQSQPQPGMPMGMMMGGGQGGMMQCPMMGGPGMGDMASHMDGHLAFLKAELKITAAQEGAWQGFADALRASATNMAGMKGMMMGGTNVPVAQAFEQQERLLSTRLDNIKRLRAAWTKLDAALTPEQKQAAQQVLVPHLMMM